jgi:hypothetical protein
MHMTKRRKGGTSRRGPVTFILCDRALLTGTISQQNFEGAQMTFHVNIFITALEQNVRKCNCLDGMLGM